jgi:protein TonB
MTVDNGAGTTTSTSPQPGHVDGHDHGHGHDHVHSSGAGSDGSPLPESRVSVPARELRKVLPAYPAEARAQEIEATVVVEIVVDASGAVRDARVTRRAGYGFDESALAAVRATRFSPARLEGSAVAVRMRYNVVFRLR